MQADIPCDDQTEEIWNACSKNSPDLDGATKGETGLSPMSEPQNLDQ